MNTIESKPIKRYLPVPLTIDEKVEYGRRLAKLHADYRDVEAQKDLSNKHFKERLEVIDGQAARVAGVVSAGEEEREVECIWRYDFPANKKELVRMDTGELVDTAAITAEERQLMLQMDQEKEATEATRIVSETK